MLNIDWPNRIINIPKTFLNSTADPNIFNLDLNVFRLSLKDEEDSPTGMSFVDTHQHNTTVDIGNTTLARVVEIINGYTVTFEDGQYAVNLIGANSNISDVANVNSVSIRSQNSAGLIEVDSGAVLPDPLNVNVVSIDGSVLAAQLLRCSAETMSTGTITQVAGNQQFDVLFDQIVSGQIPGRLVMFKTGTKVRGITRILTADVVTNAPDTILGVIALDTPPTIGDTVVLL